MNEQTPQNPGMVNPKLMRLAALISALCDERISADEFAELDALVCNDPEARLWYVQFIHLNASLHHFASYLSSPIEPVNPDSADSGGMNESMVLPALNEPDCSTDSEEIFAPAPHAEIKSKPDRNYKPAIIKGSIAALAAIVLGLMAYLIPNHNTPQLNAFNSPIAKPTWYVAELENTRNPVWDSSEKPAANDNVAAGSRLILNSGTAQFRLHHNGKLIIEGPAEVSFISDLELRVTYGQIVATFPGGGLIVQCPNGTVTDLGTEFGVAVSSEGKTEVHVFTGKVSLASTATDHPEKDLTLIAGEAAVMTDKELAQDPAGAVPQRFIRHMESDQVNSLDAVDLVCAGDGTTHRRGIGVNPTSGAIGSLKPPGKLTGDRTYHPTHGFPVVDGAFVPDAVQGGMPIDSAGHQFQFSTTTGLTMNLIWAGGKFPSTFQPVINTTIGGIDYSADGHGFILTYSNSAVTLDLNAVRRLYGGRTLTRFRCLCGNSFDGAILGAVDPTLGAAHNPVANARQAPVTSTCILVDGTTRFDRPKFSSLDGILSVDIAIQPTDRFLTLVATDDGKQITDDSILWLDPIIELAPVR